MLQRAKELWLKRQVEQQRAIRVSFTGGLGAQILSAAIYRHFMARGYRTEADLSYFDNTHRVATPGQKGQISYWKWEIDCYGVHKDSLVTKSSDAPIRTLHDGPLKFALALEALRSPEVRTTLDMAGNDAFSQPYRSTELRGERYLCLHVRRGDYVNVASHLVSSKGLDHVAAPFIGLVDRVLILSDSPIAQTDFPTLRAGFRGRVHVIDSDPDPVLAHSLMRNASVLICSNSQFSLSAGLLSDGLTIIPKTWFGAENARLNQVVDHLSDFAVVR